MGDWIEEDTYSSEIFFPSDSFPASQSCQDVALLSEKLESTMLKTQFTRQQILYGTAKSKKHSTLNTSTIAKLNDLVSGRRESLTYELEESRKNLKSLKSNPLNILKLNDLVSGKRKSLTSELEESRKRIKLLKSNYMLTMKGSLTSKVNESRQML